MRQAWSIRRRAALEQEDEEAGTETESEEKEENGRDDGDLEEVIESIAETIEKAR